MVSVLFSSWWEQSWGLTTANFVIGLITAVSMLMDFIMPWLTTRTVIHPCQWSCLPAPHCAMLSWSGEGTKVFIRQRPSQSWKWTDMIVQTTSTTWITVVRTHPAALQQVARSWRRLALQTRIQCWWIPGTHYRRATNRGCIKTPWRQSSVRCNR